MNLVESERDRIRQLEIKLNTQTSDAYRSSDYLRNMAVPVPVPRFQSAEESLQNQDYQRTEALNNIKNLLPYQADAVAFFLKLDAQVGPSGLNEIQLFNRLANNFIAFVNTTGSSLLTPDYVYQLWQRYKASVEYSLISGAKGAITLPPLERAEVVRIVRNKSLTIKEDLQEAEDEGKITPIEKANIEAAIDNAVADENLAKLEAIEKNFARFSSVPAIKYPVVSPPTLSSAASTPAASTPAAPIPARPTSSAPAPPAPSGTSSAPAPPAPSGLSSAPAPPSGVSSAPAPPSGVSSVVAPLKKLGGDVVPDDHLSTLTLKGSVTGQYPFNLHMLATQLAVKNYKKLPKDDLVQAIKDARKLRKHGGTGLKSRKEKILNAEARAGNTAIEARPRIVRCRAQKYKYYI